MKLLILSSLAALATAQSSTSSSMSTGSMSSMSMSGSASMAAASVSTAPYSITALPQVISQPSCVWNCLIPIGLADPSGCDDVTNECACLSAPSDVLDVLSGCIQTVCTDSKSAYAAVATSLYESYCTSAFGAAMFSQAFTAEAAAAASSSASEASLTASPTASASSSLSDGEWVFGTPSL